MALNEETGVYEKSDRLTAEVLEQTARRFNTARRKVNGLADFDRLNVLLRAVYQEAYWDMQQLMKDIGRSQYDDLTDAKKRREQFEDIFLLVLFDESDPITGYILGNEVERKRERLYEQVVSIKSHKTPTQQVGNTETDYGDTIVPSQDIEIRKAFDRAYNLWSHMVQEYSVRAVDVARLKHRNRDFLRKRLRREKRQRHGERHRELKNVLSHKKLLEINSRLVYSSSQNG